MRRFGKSWSRIAQMGWDERRTRAAQEINKRLDLALYRTGMLSHANELNNAVSSRGNFFFSETELPTRIGLLKQKMGAETENILREADEICRHRFRLLGYEDLDYGAEIDWHLDPVHGKDAPMEPWFKIDFLDLNEVGDHKIIWELNRQQHLVTLAKAWCLTADSRYVVELQSQWHSWQRANPYPIGINWASSLEVAFRSLSWLWILALLPGEATDSEFRKNVMRGLAIHGRHIERNLSTYFSPNTHLLGEAVALFFIGVLCPEIPAAERWRKSGWRILIEQASRQVRADGVYFERSLYYHVYALDFFLHARVLASRNGMEIPADFDAVLTRMLDVVSSLSQAGVAEGFGDDDGGRVFNPRRNRSEHMTDPLALGAILFQREDLKSAALTEEAIWLFGEEGSSYFAKPGDAPRKVGAACFNSGGIYVTASAAEAPIQMVIDAGPQGTGGSGHGHADALNVSVAIAGHRWLVDPGSYSYMGAERDRFRGTEAHNTLRMDGLDQAVPDGPFRWKGIPEVRCDKWIPGKSFTLFAGSHTGYTRLPDPVLHRRHIFYLHDEFWFIRDVVEGRKQHHLEINWHFASDIAIEKAGPSFIARKKDASVRDSGDFAVLFAEDPHWTNTIEADYVSPAYGKKDPASTVRSSSRAELPVDHATVLLPFATPETIGGFSLVELTEKNSAALSVYCYESQGRKHYMIFPDPQADTWTWNEWASDARFLYFSVEDGRIGQFIFCEGNYASLNGHRVIGQSNKIERFEWDRKTEQVFSSDDSVRKSLSVELLKSSVITGRI